VNGGEGFGNRKLRFLSNGRLREGNSSGMDSKPQRVLSLVWQPTDGTQVGLGSRPLRYKWKKEKIKKRLDTKEFNNTEEPISFWSGPQAGGRDPSHDRECT